MDEQSDAGAPAQRAGDAKGVAVRSVTLPLVGRSSELSLLRRMLAEGQRRPAALLIEGDIGAGKTTLWGAAVSMAVDMGYRVLEAHPVESEESLPYAALGDLLEGVLDDGAVRLPAPQDRALRVAMLLEEPEGDPPDHRAVSVATLNALRALSDRSPVLVAVDDLQWIDPPSRRVLEYVARRLRDERVAIVAAARTQAGTDGPAIFESSTTGWEARRLTVGPLDAKALDTLVRARIGTRLPKLVMAEVERASGGNPLFALEIALGIRRGEIEARAGEPLVVPATLQQYARERLRRLRPEVREVLFLAAATANPTVGLLEAAGPPGTVASAIEAARSADVLEVTGDRLRFAHPLFASTLYHAVPPGRRRELHRALAALVDDPDERARHLALAADGTDGRAARAMSDAAARAAARGAPDAAAALAERAVELTPPGAEEREIGRVAAAEYHFAAGTLGRAREILEEVSIALPEGPVRASVLRRLAKVRYRTDSCSIAAQLLTRARGEAGDDRSLSAQIERDLAWAVMLCGDMEAAATHAGSALELIDRTTTAPMHGEILAANAMGEFLRGAGLPSAVMRRAVSLEGHDTDAPIEWRPSMMLGMMLNWSGAAGEARRRFADLHEQTLITGEETSLPFLLTQMSESATQDGDWQAALRLADDAVAASRQMGQKPMQAAALYAKALAEAHLGKVDDARATAHAGLELAEAAGSVVFMMWNQAVLGFVELSVDDPAAAHARLAPLVAWRDVVGIREPGMLRFVLDEIEASIALGDLDGADALLAPYESDAIRLGRPWARLAAARCRALYTAAGGDAGRAIDALRRTLDEVGNEVPPFERARALLVLGSIQRRTRRRKESRESLLAALGLFDELGAAAWSAKARSLLGRSTRRKSDAELTAAERRVAEVVAAGATNREAADRLFVSVRTVELHLTSVYRKLGLRSRTELAAKMAPDASPLQRQEA